MRSRTSFRMLLECLTMVSVNLTPEQRTAVCGFYDRFARESRGIGLSDQDVAEFCLELGARWLMAHGVPGANVHLWIEQAMQRPKPSPLTAAARAANDFGGRR